MPKPHSSGAIAVAVVACVLALPPVLALWHSQAATDPDIWWHLRTAEWIIAHHAVPHTDPFSGWAGGKSWVAYSWSFELLMLGLYRLWGLRGIVIYTAAMGAAISWVLFRLLRRYLPMVWSGALTAVGMYLMWPMLWPRPGMFTVVFFILQWQVVLRARIEKDIRGIWLLPLLYVAWANVHVQFIYGLFVLGVAAIEPWIQERFGERSDPDDIRISHALWQALGACLLATLINPYGLSIYGVIWQYAQQTKAFDYIVELQALDFRRVKDYVELFLACGTFFLMGRKRQARPLFVVALCAAAIEAFRAERDAWFLVSICLAIVAVVMRPQGKAQPLLHWQRATAISAACIAVLLAPAGDANFRESALQAQVDSIYPKQACQFLANQHWTGTVFNDLDWGGYLIWTLPQMPVAIDGRTNLYGDEYLSMMEDSWDGKPVWPQNDELAKAKVILAPASLPLTQILRQMDGFDVAYDDGFAVVLRSKAQ